MSLFQTKPTTALGLVLAAALFLGFTGTASADPGKGLRWSDFAWGSSSRGQPTRPTPSHMYRPAYAYPRPLAYAQPYGYAPAVIPGQVIVNPYQTGPVPVRPGFCR